MLTKKSRGRYDRSSLRYPSDLTDDEWAHVEPLAPPAKRGGNKRRVDVREVMNGIMYVLSTGCQWRAAPKDLPPRSTLFDYLNLWSWDGALDRLHHALYVECREQSDREASPPAIIIDSRSVKSAERGAWIDPPGYDAGKKIKSKKRHILVDTLALLLNATQSFTVQKFRTATAESCCFRPCLECIPFLRNGGAWSHLHGLETSAVSTPTGGRCPRWF
jgi:transposase